MVVLLVSLAAVTSIFHFSTIQVKAQMDLQCGMVQDKVDCSGSSGCQTIRVCRAGNGDLTNGNYKSCITHPAQYTCCANSFQCVSPVEQPTVKRCGELFNSGEASCSCSNQDFVSGNQLCCGWYRNGECSSFKPAACGTAILPEGERSCECSQSTLMNNGYLCCGYYDSSNYNDSCLAAELSYSCGQTQRTFRGSTPQASCNCAEASWNALPEQDSQSQVYCCGWNIDGTCQPRKPIVAQCGDLFNPDAPGNTCDCSSQYQRCCGWVSTSAPDGCATSPDNGVSCGTVMRNANGDACKVGDIHLRPGEYSQCGGSGDKCCRTTASCQEASTVCGTLEFGAANVVCNANGTRYPEGSFKVCNNETNACCKSDVVCPADLVDPVKTEIRCGDSTSLTDAEAFCGCSTFKYLPGTNDRCCGWVVDGRCTGTPPTGGDGGGGGGGKGGGGNTGAPDGLDIFAGPDAATFKKLNPLNMFGSPYAQQFSSPAGIINRALTFAFPIAGLILFVMLVWGGFEMVLGATDKKSLEAGKQRITAALVGFFLLFASFWIIQMVEYIFNIVIL